MGMDTTPHLTAEKLQAKRHTALISALRTALANPGEHRLFRSGKLDGLFSMRTGAIGDAASLGLRAGYLEKVRTEEKGKVVIEWVGVLLRESNFFTNTIPQDLY
jgi:hypothetical protein